MTVVKSMFMNEAMMIDSKKVFQIQNKSEKKSHLTFSIEPIKKVIPITPQRFRIEDQIEQPTLYLLEAKAKQNIELCSESEAIAVALFSPSGQILSQLTIHPEQQDTWQGSLSESGLYRILVYPNQSRSIFRIKIRLSNV
ncbi:MAG: hypothetical protein WBA77_07160 [Microcoleaceae cyanobacterium]